VIWKLPDSASNVLLLLLLLLEETKETKESCALSAMYFLVTGPVPAIVKNSWLSSDVVSRFLPIGFGGFW
jgi:hypothetical protein